MIDNILCGIWMGCMYGLGMAMQNYDPLSTNPIDTISLVISLIAFGIVGGCLGRAYFKIKIQTPKDKK